MFNTIAMMSSCLMLVFVVLLPAATYVGRYHIMVIIILGAAMLGITLHQYLSDLLYYLYSFFCFVLAVLRNLAWYVVCTRKGKTFCLCSR